MVALRAVTACEVGRRLRHGFRVQPVQRRAALRVVEQACLVVIRADYPLELLLLERCWARGEEIRCDGPSVGDLERVTASGALCLCIDLGIMGSGIWPCG
jgi:hypothetical protein